MTQSTIHNSFSGGEISPSLFGRTDLGKWNNGASTMRNFFGNYRGGASSRAGTAYVGTCLQTGNYPCRDINFQFSINQGFALEFGDNTVVRVVTGTADNGSGLIRLTLVSTRGLMTGNTIVVSAVGGTTEANGTWVITVIDSTHVDLVGSSFSNAYTSGGSTSTSAGYMRIKSNGAYVIEATKAITGATVANPAVITAVAHDYVIGDWVYIIGMGGMTNFNGLTWIVKTVPSADTFTLTDLFGNTIDSSLFSAYTSGGTSARIYTIVSPYAAIDLPYLKSSQSKNTMSLTCVNQETSTEYPIYDLQRISSTNWVFTAVTFTSSITAPTGVVATAHASTTLSTYYSYVVTAVSQSTNEESIASSVSTVQNNDISVNAGSNSITWNVVSGAGSYNVYAATPQYGATTPSGVLYGFIGTSIGNNFVDTNIIADFTQVPPVHNDPFLRGGANPNSGTYPSVVAYYQQRRAYANTLNQPDTYFFSQPGAFTNMDSSIPVTDGDAFSGAPWAQQVNGIQAMQPMTNGLIILTGNGAWLLNGGTSSAITPSDQTAQSQAYNGCHNHVNPLVVNLDILYVQAKGSIVRDLSFNFFQNIFTGTDLTILSNHLFNYHQIQQWAYAEEPYKLVWAVRDDGILLSLTYLKEQDVYTWARHDTNGFYVGVCSVTEPPVDAVYLIVKRYVQGDWRYYSERMDNRNWKNAEDCFCVDAGLSYPQTFPNATLTPAAADGTNNISSVNVIIGGSGYTAPVVTAVDASGEGTGATFSVTLSSGIITAITPIFQGQNYIAGITSLVITDSTGSGAIAQAVITNIVSFTASASVFSVGNVGSVIRIGNNNAAVSDNGVTTNGGGKAIITSYISATQIMANIVSPIVSVVPNDPNNMPVPAISGQWSMTAPITKISGLNHLEGLEVAILADGSVVPNQIVTNGSVTLPQVYSAITVGLPFTCQLQGLYIEPPGESTVQGKRKNIYNVTVRCETTRGIQVGTNQPDASTQPNYANVPWTDMKEVKERNSLVTSGSSIPLFTGDFYINVPANWDEHGQLAIQQIYPLPANVLGFVTNYKIGDSSDRG